MFDFEEKFGYYTVHQGPAEFKTCSKTEALQIATRLNGWVSFHFKDEIFSQFNWSRPLDQPITEFYRKRAEQIRKEYDHVILAYSGGFDSHNILQTFIDNNIKLDALVFFYNLPNQNPHADINLEWKLQTQPRLQKILPLIPETEFIRMDISSLSLSLIDRFQDDYYFLAQGNLAPNVIAQSYLYQLLPQKHRSKKYCIMFGIEKPRVRYKNGNFYFNFLDVGHRIRSLTPESGIEFFYWSSECPELVIKQAQIVKDYWKKNYHDMISHPKNRNDNDLGIVLDHDYDPVQRLIYPSCGDGIFRSWRPKSQIFGRRDEWIFRSNTEYKQKLQKIYQSFKTCCPSHWFTQSDHRNGFIGHISRDYIL
jgi:hypothetical protein